MAVQTVKQDHDADGVIDTVTTTTVSAKEPQTVTWTDEFDTDGDGVDSRTSGTTKRSDPHGTYARRALPSGDRIACSHARRDRPSAGIAHQGTDDRGPARDQGGSGLGLDRGNGVHVHAGCIVAPGHNESMR
ncbi:hypothetical protein GCM10009777_34210 [Microbacterium pumilum]|uniref:SD-repeat containing protein B domain-containing protein n=1 Tax=Microbacterium pumilum TaxID=344165 RepID=A0ABN2SZE7_9MICO